MNLIHQRSGVRLFSLHTCCLAAALWREMRFFMHILCRTYIREGQCPPLSFPVRLHNNNQHTSSGFLDTRFCSSRIKIQDPLLVFPLTLVRLCVYTLFALILLSCVLSTKESSVLLVFCFVATQVEFASVKGWIWLPFEWLLKVNQHYLVIM